MSYKIETGVPIPRNDKKRSKYPFGDLKIGNSFFIPISDAKTGGIACCASSFSKRHAGYKFTVRAVDGGTRVWRIEEPAK